jgi:prophage regulatory protein
MQSKLLTLRDVEAATTLGRSRIYQLIAEKAFPSPIKVSPGRSAWLAAEVDTWIEARIALRDGGEAK